MHVGLTLELEENIASEDDIRKGYKHCQSDVGDEETKPSKSSSSGAARKSAASMSSSIASGSTQAELTLDTSRVDVELLKQSSSSFSGYSTPQFYGAHRPFLWRKGSPIFTIGPHWPFALLMSFLIISSGISISEFLAREMENELWVYGEYSLMLTVFVLFATTSLLNPGIAQPNNHSNAPNAIPIGNCLVCNVELDEWTFHCYDCKVCIRGYDHHCPWTGKCIGKSNLYPFRAFLLFLFIFFYYSMTLCYKSMQ